MRQQKRWFSVLGLLIALSAAGAVSALSDNIKSELATSKYVYIASTRKNGQLSKPAEIWFLYHDGSVYVGTPPTSWRAKRIKAGRPQAKIWVGKPDGPSFEATGAIVNDTKVVDIMLQTFATKYPDGWKTHEERFRNGFKDGTRVLIRYTPHKGGLGDR
jgi:hypothetical protein